MIPNIGLGVVLGGSKMSECFTRLQFSAEKDSVLPCWSSKCHLVERQTVSSCANNSCTCRFSEVQSTDGQCWDTQEAFVIRDSTNNHGSFVLLVPHQLGNL